MALNGIGEIQGVPARAMYGGTPAQTFAQQLGQTGMQLLQQARLDEQAKRQAAQDAENQRRWDITNQRAEDEAARIKADRKAQQAYFNVLGQGPQTAGGSFASPELNKLTEQSAFTQAENPIVSKYMQAAGGNDQAAMDAMRRDNLGSLADKLKTQLDISNAATKFADTGMGNESRVAMLERAIGEASKFGVPSKDMYTQLDQARLAEQTAKQNKLKDIMSQEADIEKNRVSNLKWGIDKMSGGGSDGVASGVSQYTAKDVANGTADIQKQLSTALKTVPDEKAKTYVSQLANTEYNKLLGMGINPSEAAGLVSSAISSKSNDEWYKFFQDPEAVYKKDTISSVLPQYLERAGMRVQNGKIVRTKGTGTSKEESAAALVNALSASDTAKLATLKAQREQLNKTPQEVYGDKIRQLLGEAGYGNTVSPSNAVPSGLTTSKPSEGRSGDNPLTVRLNNPGAVKAANPNDLTVMWDGQTGFDDQGHAIFDSPEKGARAMAINLNSQIKKGATLEDIFKGNSAKGIGAYSTGNQNEYLSKVSKETGIDPTKVLTQKDIRSMMGSMASMEAGKPYDSKVLDKGYELAFGTTGSKPKEEISQDDNKAEIQRLSALMGKESAFKPNGAIQINNLAQAKEVLAAGSKGLRSGIDALDAWVKEKSYSGDKNLKNAIREKIAPNLNRLLQGKDIVTEEDNKTQLQAQIAIADKVKAGKSLNKSEERWIEDMKKTSNGRAQLKRLGLLAESNGVIEGPIGYEDYYNALNSKREKGNLQEAERDYRLRQYIKDPATVYGSNPKISEETKDLFRVLQADRANRK